MQKGEGNSLIYIFIVFFIMIYYICEIFKWKKIETLRHKNIKQGRLYNEPVVYIKIIFLTLSYILLIINRISVGILERTSGLKGFFILSIMYFVFFTISAIDICKVRKGHNENLLNSDE